MQTRSKPVLAIIGQGYVGLPLAMAAVEAGWSVIGIDNSQSKVTQINSGSSPVEDISNFELSEAIKGKNYIATSDFSLVSQASVITICVPTPLNEKREPDLTLLRDATASIAPYISNDTLVVCESTSYPGTLRSVIIPIVDAHNVDRSRTIHFSSAPERVNPGDLVWNQKNTPRLVGSINSESQRRALKFYESICDVVMAVPSPEVAEAAKLLENTFRLVNIALVNEFTQLCAVSGINVNQVIDAASTKPYGFMAFRPGVGVGGHCIPVDPMYLTWWANQNGVPAPIVECADATNLLMPKFVADRALRLARKSTTPPRVLILGVAYKAGVSDVRETPVSDLRRHLQNAGALVAWHDPFVAVWENTNPVEIGWECDVAILATNQPGLDFTSLIARGIPILDCTNSLNNVPKVTQL
jgi:UDP-N-acetyl-D-glucosamine dehydrogenase